MTRKDPVSVGERRSPRILFVVQNLSSGGAERQIALLFDVLFRRGVDVWLCWYEPIEHYRALLPAGAEARATLLPRSPGWRGAGLAMTLHKHVRTVDPDVVVSFLRGPSRWTGLLALGPRRWKWVVAERTQLNAAERVRGYRTLARRADAIVSNSMTATDEFRAAGFDAERLFYLPNGVPLAPEPPAKPKTGPFRVLAVGSVQGMKNHLLLIRTLAAMKDRDWRLDHAGRPSDAALFAKIQAEVQALGVADRITFHGELRDLGPLYESADLMVLPSSFEGFPNVLLEAWNHGCPVLVSDRCDLPRLVRHGETGWVFPLDVPDGLQRALDVAFRTDREELGAMGRAGRQEVLAQYTIEAVATRWMELLERVAAGR
jgi:glycosyltransferase involved in cell wall biosynthesis